MKVAIVHYWLVNMRGGERVLEALCAMFPQADIFTHVYDPAAIPDTITSHFIKTSFIQALPRATRSYQAYLPLMPLALEQLDLRAYDLVISSESGPAKGVITRPDALHICYCHSPMRYLWDMYHDYRETAGTLRRWLMPVIFHYLRMWDVSSAARVDHFVANSAFVASRIRKYYRRDSVVIHPPVAVDDFSVADATDDFYLVVSQLVRYKRVDLAIEAFNRNGRKLVVIGDGELLHEFRKLARPNVTVLGRQPFSVIKDHYRTCKALVFPGVEDFGIVPVEAMASGRPVIAYRRGGVLETVKEEKTGIFFDEQTPESLSAAIARFESQFQKFRPEMIRAHAKLFDEQVFAARFRSFLYGECTKAGISTG